MSYRRDRGLITGGVEGEGVSQWDDLIGVFGDGGVLAWFEIWERNGATWMEWKRYHIFLVVF